MPPPEIRNDNARDYIQNRLSVEMCGTNTGGCGCGERHISKCVCLRSPCHMCLSFIKLRLNSFSWSRERGTSFGACQSRAQIHTYVGLCTYEVEIEWAKKT